MEWSLEVSANTVHIIDTVTVKKLLRVGRRSMIFKTIICA